MFKQEVQLWPRGLRIHPCLLGQCRFDPWLQDWVKDLVLLQLWYRLHLWLRFDP